MPLHRQKARIASLAVIVSLLTGYQTTAKPKSMTTNQLQYLETPMLYHPDRNFPKLTTPMWAGDRDVEAVVILSIDDLNNVKHHDDYLEPIFARLKKIENGKTPLSLMANKPDIKHARLQQWLKDGASIEVHTTDHPCPLFQKNDFEKAKRTFHSCIDTLAKIPNNTPVAFRMPCCDSMNSVSPRFFSEIFMHPTPKGNTLSIDSSVFCLLTPDDPEIPRRCVVDEAGNPVFAKYLPYHCFVNYIENYPYPYMVHNAVWEFPATVPSDWEAQFLNGVFSPKSVEDYKRAIDAIVAKKGVFTLCFHPHGWLKAEQVVELIDHAHNTYGKKVMFMSFKDAITRINSFLLGGIPVRSADMADNGVRLIDLNNDGYLDVVVGHPSKTATRIWNLKTGQWKTSPFPHPLVDDRGQTSGVKFVRVRPGGFVSLLIRNENVQAFHHFDGNDWSPPIALSKVFDPAADDLFTARKGKDRGVRCLDVNADGFTDLVINNETRNETWLWNPTAGKWVRSQASLPAPGMITDAAGRDLGHRFVDLSGDGLLDSLQANEQGYSLALFANTTTGWSKPVRVGTRTDDQTNLIPPIVEDRRLNGVWFRNGAMFVQNERTGDRPGNVHKYIFPINRKTPAAPTIPPRVLGHWTFEEAGRDLAGAVNDQALPGKGDGNRPTYVQNVPALEIHDPLTGKTRPNSRAIKCDGLDDYLRLGRPYSPELADKSLKRAQTLEAFVRLDRPVKGDDRAGLLLGRWNQRTRGGDQFAIFVRADGTFAADAQAEVGPFNNQHNSGPGGNLNDGKWHHVAAAYFFDQRTDTATVILYQDYKQVAANSFKVPGPLGYSPIPYQLGGQGDALPKPMRFVAATFDEVRISCAILTPEKFLQSKGGCCR